MLHFLLVLIAFGVVPNFLRLCESLTRLVGFDDVFNDFMSARVLRQMDMDVNGIDITVRLLLSLFFALVAPLFTIVVASIWTAISIKENREFIDRTRQRLRDLLNDDSDIKAEVEASVELKS